MYKYEKIKFDNSYYAKISSQWCTQGIKISLRYSVSVIAKKEKRHKKNTRTPKKSLQHLVFPGGLPSKY